MSCSKHQTASTISKDLFTNKNTFLNHHSAQQIALNVNLLSFILGVFSDSTPKGDLHLWLESLETLNWDNTGKLIKALKSILFSFCCKNFLCKFTKQPYGLYRKKLTDYKTNSLVCNVPKGITYI